MTLFWTPYREQKERWPAAGRHILAQYDDASIVVYQAYGPAIGQWAALHGRFGGEFSFSRMSWIKPNFLWMMFRSGWGTKEGQEVTLAVRLRRAAFDEILAQAVHSQFLPEMQGLHGMYGDEAEWRQALQASDVRLQWDPDHAPEGAPLARRALQLGLRGETLRRYATEWVLEIEDISERVAAEREHVSNYRPDRLATPSERAYVPRDDEIRRRLGLD